MQMFKLRPSLQQILDRGLRIEAFKSDGEGAGLQEVRSHRVLGHPGTPQIATDLLTAGMRRGVWRRLNLARPLVSLRNTCEESPRRP
jgi:hypothetical protein